MLALRHPQRGMSLIEVAVGLVVLAILVVSGGPSFNTWIQKSKIRAVAETITNGLQLTRAEAVQRNTTLRFQLTDTVTAACAITAAGTNWVVSLDDPTGACNAAASETVAPRLIQKSSTEGTSNVVVAADQSTIVFNGMGRVTPTPAATININVTNPTGGTCADVGGSMRCLRITVSTGGQVRLCDPALASTDPRGC